MYRKAEHARRAIGVAIESLEFRRLLSAGTLDPAFNLIGKVTHDGGSGSHFSDVKTQTDGKVLAVGQLGFVTQNQFTVPVYGVFRYTFGGQLDTDFGGGDGIAELPANWNPSSSTFDLTIQTDGRIVVGGDIYFGGLAGVARFTSAGLPDSTLNGTGSITAGLNIGSPIYSAKVIALPSGPFYIVGFDPGAGDNITPGVDVYRFNSSGTPDTNYGLNGSVHVATTAATLPRDVAISSSGKLLIAGNELTSNADFIARVTTGGAADSSFGGGDGLIEGALSGAKPNAILPIANDQFYIAGGYPQLNSEYSILARFSAAGGLDSSFGGSGVVAGVQSFGYQDAALTSDGKFVVAFNTGNGIGVSRLDSLGMPDSGFGTSGTTFLDLSDGFATDTVTKIIADPWNEAIVGGSANSGTQNVLARLTSETTPTGTLTAKVFKDVDGDGIKDPEDTPISARTLYIDVNSDGQFTPAKDAYGTSDALGHVTINNAPAGFQFVFQVVPTGWKPSAPINFAAQVTVVPGSTTDLGYFMTTPIVPTPYLDTTFGTGGTVLTGAANDNRGDELIGVARLSDGKLLAAGYAGGFKIFKYNADGTPDTVWAPNGTVSPTLPASTTPYFDMIAQPDGKLLVAAMYQNNTPALLRFNTNGQTDTAFGTNGVAILTGFAGEVHDIAVDSLGRIVVAGHNSNTDIAVARLTSGGVFDNAFDSDGKAVYNIQGYDSAWGVAVQSDDKIIVSGEGFDAVQNQLDFGYLLRLKTDGARDGTFGPNGVAFLYDADLPSTVRVGFKDVAVMPDGRIVTAGTMVTNNVNYIDNIVTARFTPDGKLDPTFGAGKGYALASFPRAQGNTYGSPRVESVQLLPDGSIYVAGEGDTTAEQSEDILAARFRSNGTLETAFGSGGRVFAPLSNGSDGVYGATVDPTTGRLIVAGYTGGDSRGLLAQFAAPAPARITGFIFNDADGDGVLDAGENALVPGRTAYLDLNNNAQLDTYEPSFTTNVDGFWFNDLSPGTYTLRAVVPAGYAQTLPAANAAYTVNVTAGSTNPRNFGITPSLPTSPTVLGTAQNDVITVTALQSGFSVAISTSGGPTVTTNYAGAVSLIDSGNGDDTITLIGNFNTPVSVTGGEGNDTIDGSLSSGGAASITLAGDNGNDTIIAADKMTTLLGGAGNDTLLAINTHPDFIDGGPDTDYAKAEPADQITGVETYDNASIRGVVFNDYNGNGVQDAATEPVLPNETVYLDMNNNGVNDAGDVATLVEGSGAYIFVGLPGSATPYVVRLAVKPGWELTAPASIFHSITVAAHQNVVGEDFGTRLKPVNPQPPFLGSPFAIGDLPATIQLEDFDNGGEGIAYHDLEKANLGGKYRTAEGVDIQSSTDTGGGYNLGYVKAGEWLEYTINVATAGNYDFDFRLAAVSANGKFHAEVDGANVTGALIVPNTGGYQTWKDVTKTAIPLTAGQHVIRVAIDANGANGSVGNFNWLKISPSNVVPPPPPPGDQTPFKGTPFAVGGSAITIQAEDFDNGGEGVAYHDIEKANQGGKYRTGEGVDINTTTDTGGGYYVGFVKAGEWLEYTVDVATAGSYTFDFRLAAASSNGKFHVEVDGVNATGALTVPNTSGWQTWKTLTKTGVTLSAGQHVIRIAMDTNGSAGSVANFNHFTIKPDGQQPPPPPPPGQSITIQAEDFDSGAEGVAYHDLDSANQGGKYRTTGVDIQTTTDTGGGYNIGYVKAGEWLNYTTTITTAGSYNFDFRLAAGATGGKFHLEVDGIDVTGAMTVPNTGGWQNWTTVTKTGVTLSAGSHVLKLKMDTNGSTGSVANFNWLKLTQN